MSESANQPDESPSLQGIHLGEVKYLPEELLAGLEERQDMLDAFAEDPENPDIWNFVASKATEEEEASLGQPLALRDIPVDSLIDFAAKVRDAKPEDRYALTTTEAPNGKLWFDVLYGFHGPSGNLAIANALGSHLRKLGEDKADVVVDLGTGTGETAAAIASQARHIVGLDRNSSLLEIGRKEHKDIQFVEGSITHLPFADESIDVLTSNGIKYSLNSKTSIGMYSEIARVLKEGGVYIDADWAPAQDIILNVNPLGGTTHPDFHPEALASFVTWRGVLQDMIVDTASGKLEIDDRLELSGHAWNDFKLQLGLYETHFQIKGGADFSSKLGTARVLHKDQAKAESEERRHRAFLRGMTS